MSHLLARIMLALLMLPLAGVMYMLVFVFAEQSRPFSDEGAFVMATIVTTGFVVTYWVLLWRKQVNWSGGRVGATAGIALAAFFPSAIIGVVTGNIVEETFGIFIAGILTVLLWLAGTVFVWRESATERAARFSGRSAQSINCLVCGYNMTGLDRAVCPECGATFTINELIAGQAGVEGADLGDAAD